MTALLHAPETVEPCRHKWEEEIRVRLMQVRRQLQKQWDEWQEAEKSGNREWALRAEAEFRVREREERRLLACVRALNGVDRI